MHKLNFTIDIKASPTHVCQLMLDDPTYRLWTAPFHPGSCFSGNWQTGSKMYFVAIENGQQHGMVSRIVDYVPGQHVFIEHLGILKDGAEILSGEDVEPWAGAREDYYFSATAEGCHLKVQMDSQQDWADFFQQTWPKALQLLKSLAEGQPARTPPSDQ